MAKEAAHKQRKADLYRLGARVASGRRAVKKRRAAAAEQYAADTEYRGALIGSQRGGLASTILNLGGAAGDPNKSYASQLVGTQAQAAPLVPEAFETKASVKKRLIEEGRPATVAEYMKTPPRRKL